MHPPINAENAAEDPALPVGGVQLTIAGDGEKSLVGAVLLAERMERCSSGHLSIYFFGFIISEISRTYSTNRA